jgi:hypothetical protein
MKNLNDKEYFYIGIVEPCNSWKKRLFVMCKLPCIVVALIIQAYE